MSARSILSFIHFTVCHTLGTTSARPDGCCVQEVLAARTIAADKKTSIEKTTTKDQTVLA